jgi:hypothetical protein
MGPTCIIQKLTKNETHFRKIKPNIKLVENLQNKNFERLKLKCYSRLQLIYFLNQRFNT